MTAVADAGTAARTTRLDVRALTGLRIVAAMWVVLFHWSFTPPPELEGTRRALHTALHAGYLGVDVFYVISGFVITLSYLDVLGPRLRPRLIGRYLWARVCRVWPAYALVTVVFGAWLLYHRAHVPTGQPYTYQTVMPSLDLRSWVEQLFLVQQWHRPFTDGSSFIGACWSASAEMLAYVLFPLLALVLHRLRRLPPWLLFGLAVVVMLPLPIHTFRVGNPYFAWSWTLRLGLGFLSGSLLCLAVRQVRITPRVTRVAGAVAVLGLVQLGVVLAWAAGRPDDRAAVGVAVFPVVVGGLALATTGLGRVLSSDNAVLGGKISYSLYLVHVPVLEWFWIGQMNQRRIAPGGAYTGLVVPNLVVGGLVLAWLMWRYVEEPARTGLRRLVEQRRPRVEELAPEQPVAAGR